MPWLQYDNIHLALDPEFAYLAENNLPGERILRIHQFLGTMIVDKPELDWNYDRIALTISADGSDASGVQKALTCISQGDTIDLIISA